MKIFHLLALGFFFGSISCNIFRSSNRPAGATSLNNILVVGHRGEAAHFPENSIEGFLSAVERGVDALELDVIISADQKVVVSHEAYMSSNYMLDPEGKSIPKDQQLDYNLYQMPYDSIRNFDGGSKWNKKFPRKKRFETFKPLLAEVIDSVDNFTSAKQFAPVTFMVEMKSNLANYGRYQPYPEEFADLVMQVIVEKGIEDRTIIKSFDPNLLNVLRRSYPDVPISFLVSKKGIRKNLSRLHFTPDYYSPRHKLVRNREFVDNIHNMGMRIIPWTVNRKRSIRKMLSYGVDGIITDYPDRVLKELNK